MNSTLQQYQRKLTSLRQGVTKYGPAPHKPVLLLAVMDGFERGLIVGNRIDLSPELVGRFKSIWNQLVTTDHCPLVVQPFFYMRSEKFWHHVPYPGFEEWVAVTKDCQSIGVLKRTVQYAALDTELFLLLSDPVSREVLRQAILNRYFPHSSTNEFISQPDLFENLKRNVVEEDPEKYRAEVLRLQRELDKESFEEEVFIRCGAFKQQISKFYDNTCCISGLKVETTVNATLIDACHIVPFSESHDDTISNGIALCPTLHRAFDRGLIAIDPDQYTVLVSGSFTESTRSVYSISQFKGRQIQRPQEKRFYPGRENLARHLERFAGNF